MVSRILRNIIFTLGCCACVITNGCSESSLDTPSAFQPTGSSTDNVRKSINSEQTTATKAILHKDEETTSLLPNLLQITDRIYSGGEPSGEEAFASLARLGITTVVSVDGAQPDVEMAHKYGLRYVHIPFGYDGIDENAGLSLARLVRDLDGPFYIHCHHGRHRGPAAAAVACIASGARDGKAALAILEQAGTSKNYAGLWRDVENYQVPSADAELPELVEVAEVDSLAAAMAKIDRAYDHLKLCRDINWAIPKAHPDLVPSQEALLIKEALRESRRMLTNDIDPLLTTWLLETENVAQAIETTLRTEEFATASQQFSALEQSCKRCHNKYRN